VEVVTFTGTLTHTGKYGITAVLDGDVTDQLHHVYGFTNTGTTEQTNFTTLGKRANQVNNLDAGFHDPVATSLIGVAWGSAVDGPAFFFADWAGFVDRVAQNVHDATQGFHTHRNWNTSASVGYIQATLQAFG